MVSTRVTQPPTPLPFSDRILEGTLLTKDIAFWAGGRLVTKRTDVACYQQCDVLECQKRCAKQ